MDKKTRARELYENEGLTLAEISRQLGISYNTVRSWKYRDNKSGSIWSENYKSRKRCMVQAQLDNLVLYEKDNKESFKHGLYSNRLSPEAQELFDTEFKDTASNLFIYSIQREFCRYVCAGKGLDYSHPTGVLAESSQAMRLLKMIRSYIELKDTFRELSMLEAMRSELEPEKQDRVAEIIEIKIKDTLAQTVQYFPEAESLLLVA